MVGKHCSICGFHGITSWRKQIPSELSCFEGSDANYVRLELEELTSLGTRVVVVMFFEKLSNMASSVANGRCCDPVLTLWSVYVFFVPSGSFSYH